MAATGPTIVLSLVLACSLAALAWQAHRMRVLSRRLGTEASRRGDLARLVRLTAGDLRGPALGLLGNAEQVAPPLKSGLLSVCRGLLDLAETLLDQTDEPGVPRTLREETLQLGPMLDVVVAQVTAQLGPGRRAWRLGPNLHGLTLRADRRALHQVLLRVITSAALSTADGDWIEITARLQGPTWTLIVEDEGAGLALGRTAPGGLDTRGLGVGLAVARRLMQAHGGELALQSTLRVGTRALLSLPASRLLAASSPPAEPLAQPADQGETSRAAAEG